MQVLSYLKNARRSMRHKLIGYMIVLAVLLIAALYAGLTLFGRLSSPKAEIKHFYPEWKVRFWQSFRKYF